MGDVVKATFIAAAAVLAAVSMNIYFSPYHSCMREPRGETPSLRQAIFCAHGWARGGD
jgi:hypothetical protein